MRSALKRFIVAAAFVGAASSGIASPPQDPSKTGDIVVDAICAPGQARSTDVTLGRVVRTYPGRFLLGTVEVIGPDGVVVTGKDGSLRFPFEAFGLWCDNSLLLKISKHRFKQLAKGTTK